MAEPVLPFSLHNGGTGPSDFLKLKDRITSYLGERTEGCMPFSLLLALIKTQTTSVNYFSVYRFFF